MAWRKKDDDELAQALGLTGGRKPKDWKVTHAASGMSMEGPNTGDKAADMLAGEGLSELERLLPLLDRFDFWFNIVTP